MITTSTSTPFVVRHSGYLLVALTLVTACGSNRSAGSLSAGSDEQPNAGGGGAAAGSGGLDGLSSGSDGSGGADVCKAEVATAQRIPLDLLVVLDRSGSMSHGEWTGVLEALDVFLQDPTSAGIRVGLSFFPAEGVVSADACSPWLYDEPTVDFGELPDHYASLVDGLQAQSPVGASTPTWGALKGSLTAAAALQDAQPNHKVALVLASDGAANGCADPYNEAGELASLAASARNYNGVETYTIAMQGALIDELDQIAEAGGTEHAYDVTDDITQFSDKMSEIRAAAASCAFAIPQSDGEDFDPLALNVSFSPDGGVFSSIPHVESPFACGIGIGWYYDQPANPTKVVLCPTSCSDLGQGTAPEVLLEFGCPTIIK